jgi:hypothetical protein
MENYGFEPLIWTAEFRRHADGRLSATFHLRETSGNVR